MAMASNERQIQTAEKQELAANGAERTRARRTFIPRVDIYETNADLVLMADMPGVDKESVDITLEKNVLTITGNVELAQPDNYDLAYAEYEVGDYQRSFTLSSEIDREKIEAVVQNGVLRLRLPKVGQARAKKIAVKAA